MYRIPFGLHVPERRRCYLNLLDKIEILLKERILRATRLLLQKQTQNVPNIYGPQPEVIFIVFCEKHAYKMFNEMHDPIKGHHYPSSNRSIPNSNQQRMSDLNLNEEEIVKLSSLGTHANSKENIDVLKKSLVVRHKMYKDLIAKCNTLGRDEARARKKLEKAKEKLEKLKTIIQEMETSSEIKNNELLRSLKASKNTNSCPNVLNAPDLIHINPCTPQSTIYASDAAIDDRKTKRFRGSENIDERNNKKDGVSGPTPTPAPEINSYILIDDDDDDEVSISLEKLKDDDVVAQDKSMPDITKEASLPFLDSQQGGGGGGEFCFSGGLLDPDGSKRHLGKWCKKGFNLNNNNNNNNASSIATPTPMQAASGDLIAVGSDGRGFQEIVSYYLQKESWGPKQVVCSLMGSTTFSIKQAKTSWGPTEPRGAGTPAIYI
ncbi:unnamed protein product [Lactuca virosa]|uniref:Uncharacterized protein n=1 Tax=Lactuca virosa TaxID=75947 RepID=A0AAU9PWK7_9ASTR|nr:unnamed protein product [Lactuca virosa]